jgi:indolepyruvate ferredoxin oxidoreductase, beta subunit
MTKNILLVGVGGQGTILASKLLTNGLMEAGYDVKMSEIHGMSQRGGSVSTHVRFGEKVASPVIEIGGADLLVAFEKMEALRWFNYLKPGGKVVVNDYELPPMPVISGKVDYPVDTLDEIKRRAKAVVINAVNEAEKLGNTKVMNVILLGSIIHLMGLEQINWQRILEKNIKPNFIDLNLQALKIGMESVVVAS